MCRGSSAPLLHKSQRSQLNVVSTGSLFEIHIDEIFMFCLSANSWIISLFEIHIDAIFMFCLYANSWIIVSFSLKRKLFIIFRRCVGPAVAVKATTCASGHNDRSSPILEKDSLNGASSLDPSPLNQEGHDG